MSPIGPGRAAISAGAEGNCGRGLRAVNGPFSAIMCESSAHKLSPLLLTFLRHVFHFSHTISPDHPASMKIMLFLTKK